MIYRSVGWAPGQEEAEEQSENSTALLALHCTALHCAALHCTALHYTALHCTTLHCAALHCTAVHFKLTPRRIHIRFQETLKFHSQGLLANLGDEVIILVILFLPLLQGAAKRKQFEIMQPVFKSTMLNKSRIF